MADGRSRTPNRGAGWVSLSSLGRPQHYDPSQPRVPAGHSDGGQWTRMAPSTARAETNDTRGRRHWTRIAASEPPGLGWRSLARAALMEVLVALIRDHRNENADPDLFGHRKDMEDGAVASAILDGKALIGVNRYFPSYTTDDYRVAIQLRRYLINRYPGVMDTKNIGRMPNDAVFHAEATLLLRAAQANGGTLAGKTLEVLVDKGMCQSCKGDSALYRIGGWQSGRHVHRKHHGRAANDA